MKRVVFLTEWLWEVVQLHFIFLLFIVRGCIIGGFLPATTTVYAIIRHWFKNGADESTFVLFKKYYKENFKIANLLGWLFIITSFMIYLNWNSLMFFSNPLIKVIIYTIIVFFSMILLLLWTYIFPVLVQYELVWYQYFLLIIKLGINYLPITILQFCLVALYFLVLINYPVMIIFFGITIIACIQTIICNTIFMRVSKV